MGLLEEFKNEGQRPRMECRVKVVLQVMTDDDQQALREALADPTVTAAAIARVLARRDIICKEASITRHRRKECTCD